MYWVKVYGEIIELPNNKISLEEMIGKIDGFIKPLYINNLYVIYMDEDAITKNSPINITINKFLKEKFNIDTNNLIGYIGRYGIRGNVVFMTTIEEHKYFN